MSITKKQTDALESITLVVLRSWSEAPKQPTIIDIVEWTRKCAKLLHWTNDGDLDRACDAVILSLVDRLIPRGKGR